MSSDPPRSLGLEGASNFRDLGGYRGHDNARVVWRRLYRSDHLGALTPPDMARLSALGLARVVDFRGVSERLLAPCAQPGVVVHSMPIEPTVVARLRREGWRVFTVWACRITEGRMRALARQIRGL